MSVANVLGEGGQDLPHPLRSRTPRTAYPRGPYRDSQRIQNRSRLARRSPTTVRAQSTQAIRSHHREREPPGPPVRWRHGQCRVPSGRPQRGTESVNRSVEAVASRDMRRVSIRTHRVALREVPEVWSGACVRESTSRQRRLTAARFGRYSRTGSGRAFGGGFVGTL